MAEAPALRVSVRLPQVSDIRDLERAERLCFVDPWPGQFFVSELFAPGRYHRVMVDSAGQIVAYLFSAWQYLDLHILKIATLPQHRGEGLARQLMEMAEEHVADMCGDSLTLEVRVSNGAAIAMYKKLGYADAGFRTGYYADGEDALIMTKRIALPGDSRS